MEADDLTILLAIIQSFRQVQFSLVQSDTATKAAPAIFTRPSGLVELCTRERKYDVSFAATDKYIDDRRLVAPNESSNASIGFSKLSSG
jgi:hypothetical protein